MPNRIVREGILTSRKMCRLGWPEEVFFRRLMSIADDYGRFDADVALLRSKCYPLQVDKVREADISRWIAACEKAGLIALYEVLDKQYLVILDFQQQRRSPSKYPPPPSSASTCNQLIADAQVDVVGVVVVENPRAGARKRGQPVDKSAKWWATEPGVIERAKALGMEPRPGESVEELRARIFREEGHS